MRIHPTPPSHPSTPTNLESKRVPSGAIDGRPGIRAADQGKVVPEVARGDGALRSGVPGAAEIAVLHDGIPVLVRVDRLDHLAAAVLELGGLHQHLGAHAGVDGTVAGEVVGASVFF